jgi:dTDP-4-amino-4,6-dideoxygalactose transaminase
MIVNHGSKVKYYHEIIGVNSRLDSIQAAVLKVKLKHLDTYGESRFESASYYNKLLSDVENIVTPFTGENSEHVFHQYTLRLKSGDRNKIVQGMRDLGIPCMIYYPVPLHQQDAYRQEGNLPISEKLSELVFSLPMHTELKREDQDYIIENLRKLV